MSAFQFRMPAGIPGAVTRVTQATIEPQVMLSSAPLPAYGLGAVLDVSTGKMRLPTTGDTSIYGLLVRPFPTNNSQDPIGVSTPAPFGMCDILKRGYMTVLLQGATAAVKGGPVWVRVGGATGPKPAGGIEAAVDGGTAAYTVALPGAYFTGPADANGNVEIAYNI